MDDKIGEWSVVKLKVFKYYIDVYSKIITQAIAKDYFDEVEYIDGFASKGQNVTKEGNLIDGSPLIAYNTNKFSKYHFIDLDPKKLSMLKETIGEHEKVKYYNGDCNEIIRNQIIPQLKPKTMRTRTLCILDPYGNHLDWDTVVDISKLGIADLIIHFSLYDLQRNGGVRIFDKLTPESIDKFNNFFGCKEWINEAYKEGLLEDNIVKSLEFEKNLLHFYVDRLKSVAGFKFVGEPLQIKGPNNATLFYLIFASHNESGLRLAKDVIKKYKAEGVKPKHVIKQNRMDKSNMESDNRLF